MLKNLISLLIPLLIFGCVNQNQNEKFSKLVQEFMEDYFKFHPVTATWVGYHKYDGLLDDLSNDALKRKTEWLEKNKEKFSNFDPKKLSKDNEIDRRILIEKIDEMLFELKELKEHEWNPLIYNSIIGDGLMYLITQDFAPAEDRLKSALERVKQIPRFIEQAKLNLKDAPQIHIETAIKQNKGNINILQNDLIKFAESLNISNDLKSELKRASEKAISSLEDFGRWLEDELKPRSKRDFRLGKELYYKKMKYYLKTDLTPDEILSLAESEKNKTHEEMYHIALALYKYYYGREPKGKDKLEVIKSVLDKIVLEHPKPSEIMERIKMDLNYLTQFVKEKDLLTLDESKPLVVRETPEYQRGVAVASLEAPGPLEKNMKTFYNVSPIPDDWTPEQVESYLREYNYYSLLELSIHEAIPGHYVQLYYSNRCPSIVRSVFWSGTMVEGWAVYAERLMIENGILNNDPKMKLIHLKWYLRVIINAILDHKIHAGNMTQEEAIELMTREGFQERAEAEGKWRRACLTSAQLSSYFTGFQEIMKLREEYMKLKGEKFNIKEFNEKLLSHGSPPVKYLREILLF
ncbi:Uncharacterized conserved protein, DUF885 familyt [Candidatus Thermokryptus mobilis]|uniref:Uncharacterized conserved protein, DUF885 familyt n=1 Tax=Candidatus Thermokryptus mobilis TaxID=1643428 RepID=A0A0S4MSF5_9BACT|nr:DUF885 domain-containing protein [Candidatus Thermokryptus mobilis]CUU01943.1 Uncharacterized conserved protein, DUF885 familyt [Candidatus Thermokryptus mobilis]